jgi:hypothetical protein
MLGDRWRCWGKVSPLPHVEEHFMSDHPHANFRFCRVKTNDKSSGQHMEVKDGALQLSFHAPQIIGWISDVLPELPRGDIPRSSGLNGTL